MIVDHEPALQHAVLGDQLLEQIRQAGISGLGGAGFPTAVKLNGSPSGKIRVLIINGTECEPYVTCDHRLMLERTADIVEALRLIMRTVNAHNGHIGIESNKSDAVEAFRNIVGGDPRIDALERRAHNRGLRRRRNARPESEPVRRMDGNRRFSPPCRIDG